MHGMTLAIEDHTTFAPVDNALRWYALLVVSGKEREVCIWLRRRQYQPYWPRYMGQVKLNRHRRAKRMCSVLPGYLFMPDTRAINWRNIEDDAPNVIGFMSSGSGDLITLPHEGKQGIEKIKEIESALQESSIAAAEGIPFKLGQKVWIEKLSCEGKILAIASRRQISVEVPMFGTRVTMWSDASDIESM